MSIKFLFFFTILALIAQGEKLSSKEYKKCISINCSDDISNTEAVDFLTCANSTNNCVLGKFSESVNEFDIDCQQSHISQCQSSTNDQTGLIKTITQCIDSCLNDEESESSSISLNLPLLIIIFGIILITILFYVIYACIKKNLSTPQKCEWQVQQEVNARNQAQQNNQPQVDVIFPTPLPNLPEGDYYKLVTDPKMLKPRKIDEEFAKFLFEQAYKKLYGDQVGIQGVIQYGIPLYDFPCPKETKELNIVEAEIFVPMSNPEEHVIDVQALQTNKIQIASQNQEEVQSENPESYIININDIEKSDDEKKQVEELTFQNNDEQIKQKCSLARKLSANFQRGKQNQIGNQQNLRRLTCI